MINKKSYSTTFYRIAGHRKCEETKKRNDNEKNLRKMRKKNWKLLIKTPMKYIRIRKKEKKISPDRWAFILRFFHKKSDKRFNFLCTCTTHKWQKYIQRTETHEYFMIIIPLDLPWISKFDFSLFQFFEIVFTFSLSL